MKSPKLLGIAMGGVLAIAAMMPLARADEWNQATKLTFDQSFEVPGLSLPAGTYWFKVPDSSSGRKIVQIYNSDRSEMITQLPSIATERVTPTDRPELSFAEAFAQHSPLLLTWFYPDRTIGHEFVYPSRLEREISEQPVVVVDAHRSASGGYRASLRSAYPRVGD